MSAPKLPGLEAALRDLESLNGVDVTAGLQGRAAPGESSMGELVEIGTQHEYGIGVPERPFMSRSVERYGMDWIGLYDGVVMEVTRGEPMRAQLRLRALGAVMVGDIQQTITDGPWSPNSEATKERKRRGTTGEVRPLIDTGQMRQSIRAQVEAPGAPPVVVG